MSSADIAVLLFIALLAITFISASIGIALVKKNVKLSNRLFKVAMTAGSICLFIALMIILTAQQVV